MRVTGANLWRSEVFDEGRYLSGWYSVTYLGSPSVELANLVDVMLLTLAITRQPKLRKVCLSP
jgi:hypothetical protein